MASGFKDWDVPVNINSQTLGEIINRPKYGAAQSAAVIINGIGLPPVDIISIAGRGMIYGGFIMMSGDVSHDDDIFSITIDGVTTIFNRNNIYIFRGLYMPYTSLIFLTKYDDVNFLYTHGFGYGFTFEESLVVNYNNESIDAGSILTAELYYALI